MSLCRVFFWTEELQTEALELIEFTDRFCISSKHCFDSLITEELDSTVHSRRCGNWQAMKMDETLFPNCMMPHYSYIHAEYNCYTKAARETVEIVNGTFFRADVVTTAQTAQTMCFSCSLGTAREIMETGVIPKSLFTNGQLNCWFTPRSSLLRTLQMHWAGINTELDEKMVVLCFNPSLHRFLTSATVHQLTTNFVDEARTVEALTAFNRTYLGHCWATGALEGDVTLNGMECRSAVSLWHFTAIHCARTD